MFNTDVPRPAGDSGLCLSHLVPLVSFIMCVISIKEVCITNILSY